MAGLQRKGEWPERLYSQKHLMNFGVCFDKCHAPTHGHQFNELLRSMTSLERCESLHWLRHDSHPSPAPGALLLSFGPFAPASCWEGLSAVPGVYKGKWVMMMDFVMAACLESLTPNNDPKYWDLLVLFCFVIPPRMSYVKPLIQSEEPFQKCITHPLPWFSSQIGAVWLFLCSNCYFLVSLCAYPFYAMNFITNYATDLLGQYCLLDPSCVTLYQKIIEIRARKVLPH